ncbi:unnamed protein product [Durusdinium trenchii]|uniref:LINE-1 retrotransposable element ORF2 protein n=2 Tax=Durusdinium trenchii TaxID=1381693 RepID=A0ABP0Q2F3_9DINO
MTATNVFWWLVAWASLALILYLQPRISRHWEKSEGDGSSARDEGHGSLRTVMVVNEHGGAGDSFEKRERSKFEVESHVVWCGIWSSFSVLWLLPFSLVVWSFCIWLPTTWANFFAVTLQLACWAIAFTVMIGNFLQSLYVSGDRPRKSEMVRAILLLVLALIAILTVTATAWSVKRHLHQGVCEGGVPPAFLKPLESFTDCNDDSSKPEACKQIQKEDVVTDIEGGIECFEWCRGRDLFVPYFADTHDIVCFKAEAWAACAMFDVFGTSFPVLAILSAVLYGLPQFYAWVQRKLAERKTHHLVRGQTDEESSESYEPPSETSFREEGPYRSQSWLYRILGVRSDKDAETLNLRLAHLLNTVEPLADVYSGIGLLEQGQPYYGFFMLAATLVPNWLNGRDLFQVKMSEAIEDSIRKGFPTHDLLKHQDREGRYEGTMSAIVAVCAFMRTPSLQIYTVISLVFGFTSSALLSIPAACQASVLLDSGIHQDDYYNAVQLRKQMTMGEMYYLSAWTIGLGNTLGWFLCSWQHLWTKIHNDTFGASSLCEVFAVAFGFGVLVSAALGLMGRGTFLEKAGHLIGTLLSLLFWLSVCLEDLDVLLNNRWFEDGLTWQTRKQIGCVVGLIMSVCQIWLFWSFMPEIREHKFQPGRYRLKQRMGECILAHQEVRVADVQEKDGQYWGILAEGKWIELYSTAKPDSQHDYSYRAKELQYVSRFKKKRGKLDARVDCERKANEVVEICQIRKSGDSINGRLAGSEVYIQLADNTPVLKFLGFVQGQSNAVRLH